MLKLAAAEAARVSVRTISKWRRRYRSEGEQGHMAHRRRSLPRTAVRRLRNRRRLRLPHHLLPGQPQRRPRRLDHRVAARM